MNFKVFLYLFTFYLEITASLLKPRVNRAANARSVHQRKLDDNNYNPIDRFDEADINKQSGFVYPKFKGGYGMMGPYDYATFSIPHAMNPGMYQAQPLFNPFFHYQSMMNPVASMMNLSPNSETQTFYEGNYNNGNGEEQSNM